MISFNTTRPPTANDGGYACARVGFVQANNPADLRQKALAAGFQDVGNNQYTHPSDGSWVMLDASGRVQRGVGNTMFQGIPKAPAGQAAPPAPAQATFTGGGVAKDNSRPPVPQSMLRPTVYAITQVGICTMANVHTNCQRQGFVDVGGTYVHSDGSWVSYAGGRIAVGWKGYALNELRPAYVQGWK